MLSVLSDKNLTFLTLGTGSGCNGFEESTTRLENFPAEVEEALLEKNCLGKSG